MKFPDSIRRCSVLILAALVFAGCQSARDVSHYPQDPAALPGKGPATAWSGLPKVWAQRHAQWAKTAEQDKGAVVFLGDSITQGWNSLARDFPDLKTANRGIGGDTTRGVLYRLDADVIALKPKAVVLLIGTNDIGNGADADDVAANIEMILLALQKSNPKMPIVVCRVMPRGDQNGRFVGKIEQLNSMIDDFVKNRPGFAECDTWSIFADANGGCQKEDFHPDLLHINAAGYAKWTAALQPIFAKLNL
ncbi:MAG TPA: GDSL-type esterase/lipase family protein [Verrucomicrobiae bacterium]|nr:GDSL-type esterase/lipase family protein [Verrucomicrobiae bacterium]